MNTSRTQRSEKLVILIDDTKGALGNPWGISFRQGLFNMTSDSGIFRTSSQLGMDGARRDGVTWIDRDGETWVSLYEAKMIHLFDHRWATYEENGTDLRDATESEKKNPNYEPLPRYWVPLAAIDLCLQPISWQREWYIGFRKITIGSSERSFVTTVIPHFGTGDSLSIFFPKNEIDTRLCTALYASLSSLCFDYVVRQKIGGTDP